MTRLQAMKKLVAGESLSTAMLKPLGISMEAFLRFVQLGDVASADVMRQLRAKYKTELASRKLAAKAEKMLREGDIDQAFDMLAEES